VVAGVAQDAEHASGALGGGQAVGFGGRGTALDVDEDPLAVADDHARRDRRAEEGDHAQRGGPGEAVVGVEETDARREQQHDTRRDHRPPRPPTVILVGGDRVQRRQAEHRQERAVVTQVQRDERCGDVGEDGDGSPPPPEQVERASIEVMAASPLGCRPH
jgi:hypothetical protein